MAFRTLTLGFLIRCSSANDQTDITTDLNTKIAQKQGTVYGGGKGVIIRNINDGLTGDASKKVVPGSFLVNDIVAVSISYPNGNPMCPSGGWNGYQHQNPCTEDPWTNAGVLAVVGNQMNNLFKDFDKIQDSTWGYGVFYGTDSNSADKRCRWLSSDNGWDCPGYWLDTKGNKWGDNRKLGAGGYDWGNPYGGGGGGGAGCHFNAGRGTMDQYDGWYNNQNLVRNSDCECNYALNGQGWQDWVEQWIQHGKSKAGFNWEGWFAGGKAPNWAVDLAACWVNNPRDMIYIQNMMWFHRFDWSNQLQPQSSWQTNDPASQRRYWGWNEVPLQATVVNNPSNWDAIVIKLPAAICPKSAGGQDSIHCLSPGGQVDLENQLDWYVNKGYLKLGEGSIGGRPGSYIVLLREWEQKPNYWQRYFFCESWNAERYQVVYKAPWLGYKGECYLDKGTGPAPTPPAPPPPPPCHGSVGRFMLADNHKICIDVAGGPHNGARVQLWDCNGHNNQNFIWCSDGRIVSAANDHICLDVPGGDPSKAVDMQMWTCNGMGGQYWKYDSNTMSIFPAKTGEKMCLDTDNGASSPGTGVNLYYCNPGNGEKWFTAAKAGNSSASDFVTI